jgi:hypothetical protein
LTIFAVHRLPSAIFEGFDFCRLFPAKMAAKMAHLGKVLFPLDLGYLTVTILRASPPGGLSVGLSQFL